jgi:hypothetical protein
MHKRDACATILSAAPEPDIPPSASPVPNPRACAMHKRSALAEGGMGGRRPAGGGGMRKIALGPENMLDPAKAKAALAGMGVLVSVVKQGS